MTTGQFNPGMEAIISKALAATQTINPTDGGGPGDATALRVESLERTLRTTTFKAKHIKLFNMLPKVAAYNTVQQFNQLVDYGQGSQNGFIGEGALPEEGSSTYRRQVAIMKYLGVTRSVTHQASLVQTSIGNMIAQETINGTMELLRNLEVALLDADSRVDELEFEGFKTLIERGPNNGTAAEAASPASNIIDMRGAPLSDDVLMDSSMVMHNAPNYGNPTHLMLNPDAHKDLMKSFFPKARYDAFAARNDGKIGLNLPQFTSEAGDVDFVTNTFMTAGKPAPTEQVGVITNIATAVTAAAGAAGTPTYERRDGRPQTFQPGEEGVYHYSVVSVGKRGSSAAVAAAAPATVTTTNNVVTLTIRNPAGEVPKYYEIYRSTPGGGPDKNQRIGRIKAGAANTDTVFVDVNAELPDASYAILFEMTPDVLSFMQLAPMVKIPLATIDGRIRWMQLLYGTPALYNPKKILLIKNIGKA